MDGAGAPGRPVSAAQLRAIRTQATGKGYLPPAPPAGFQARTSQGPDRDPKYRGPWKGLARDPRWSEIVELHYGQPVRGMFRIGTAWYAWGPRP